MWALSKKDPQKLDALLEHKDVVDSIPEQGDGKAVFLSEGTEKDFEEYENSRSGMGRWLDRLKNLK